MSKEVLAADLSANDARLVEEALRRLQARAPRAIPSHEALVGVLVDQDRRGRRDMFSLVRAGRRALDEA